MASSAQPVNLPLNTPLVSGFATARLFQQILALHILRGTGVSDRDREPPSTIAGISQSSRIRRCLSTHGRTATCSMQRSTTLCRCRAVMIKPIQENRPSRTGQRWQCLAELRKCTISSLKSAMTLDDGLNGACWTFGDELLTTAICCTV